MKFYHRPLSNSTVIISDLQSAKPTSLQAAVVYVNLHSKSNLTAQRLRRRVERGLAAARAFNPMRLAWK